MTLYHSNQDDISISIFARVNLNGDLVVEGVDHGPKVKEIQGDSDYEYALTIKAKRQNYFDDISAKSGQPGIQ